MGLVLSRIKQWDEESAGFVYWSAYHIAEQFKKLNRTTPITLIDIGANVGKASDILKEMLNIKEYYMFEPCFVLYNYLTHKYKDKEEYKIFNCAVSDQDDPYLSFDQSSLNEQLSVTYEKEYLNLGLSKTLDSLTCIKVPNIKLSKFLNDNPHLYEENVIIKIDTENRDFFILKDFRTVLTSFKSAPLVEFEVNHGNTGLTDTQAQEILDLFVPFYHPVSMQEIHDKHKGDELLVPTK